MFFSICFLALALSRFPLQTLSLPQHNQGEPLTYVNNKLKNLRDSETLNLENTLARRLPPINPQQLQPPIAQTPQKATPIRGESIESQITCTLPELSTPVRALCCPSDPRRSNAAYAVLDCIFCTFPPPFPSPLKTPLLFNAPHIGKKPSSPPVANLLV